MRLQEWQRLRHLAVSIRDERQGMEIDPEQLLAILDDVVPRCFACDNRARYSSGYCGLCDLTLNDGRGIRV